MDGRGRREIDADGLLVTPGFVDIHTHYDGQVTWDPLLTPSCWHGVTTVVMGNCGVGFAPVASDRHEWLIGLMEGVEDIPGAALSAGIQWAWESFPEYLDTLDRLPKAIDIGTQVPHGAVRGFVMGERGARNEPATPDDIEAMAAIVREGIAAGALGFSTSRTLAHRAIDGEPVPGTFAAEDELFGIGRVLGELGTAVFELAPAGALGEDLAAPEKEMDWMRRLSSAIGRPVTFALNQNNNDPEAWRRMLDLAAAAAADGARVRPQVHGRTVSLLLGLQTFHPFNFCPTWASIGLLPWQEQAARLRDEPELRARLIGEATALEDDPIVSGFMHPSRIFVLGDPPDYEPPPSSSVERHRRGNAALAHGKRCTTCCSPTVGASCSTRPCSTTRTATSTRRARCSCTRRPRSGSVTVARTRVRPAMRARRRTSSATGPATADTTASRSRPPCTSSPARRRRCSGWVTAACSRRG